MLLLHQINQWYCKGALTCQPINCESLMSYWLYRVGFEIGRCISCKRANDSYSIVLLKLCVNILFFVLHLSFCIYLFIVLFLGLYSCSSPRLSHPLLVLHQQLCRLHVLVTLLHHNLFPFLILVFFNLKQ